MLSFPRRCPAFLRSAYCAPAKARKTSGFPGSLARSYGANASTTVSQCSVKTLRFFHAVGHSPYQPLAYSSHCISRFGKSPGNLRFPGLAGAFIWSKFVHLMQAWLSALLHTHFCLCVHYTLIFMNMGHFLAKPDVMCVFFNQVLHPVHFVL